MQPLPSFIFLCTLILLGSCRTSLSRIDFNYEAWKQDSTGSLGYRNSLLNNDPKLKNKIMHQRYDTIRHYLGEPNRIEREIGPKFYYYYYWLSDCDTSASPSRSGIMVMFSRNLAVEFNKTQIACDRQY